jgi:hypothetical protein
LLYSLLHPSEFIFGCLFAKSEDQCSETGSRHRKLLEFRTRPLWASGCPNVRDATDSNNLINQENEVSILQTGFSLAYDSTVVVVWNRNRKELSSLTGATRQKDYLELTDSCAKSLLMNQFLSFLLAKL